MNGTHSVTCGTAATYYNVTVQANNNSYGTATPSYKSGYVYANNRSREYKKNSVYTITATPNSGYRFVRWEKNGSQISTDAVTDVVIDGNATYTAYFEANNAPQYTITVQTATPDYCTVSGGGTYYAGTNVTISSASKNEHLYIFDRFVEAAEDEDLGEPSFNITVTGDATYTAYYRLANAGNITATAAHGTVSGTGNYAGGTAVQLGVTPDDGYSFTQWSDGNTDNPRTVYVDGDANYTAEFMYGVSLNLLAGCSPSSPLEYRVLLPDYEIYFRAGNSWSYGDGEEIPLSYINTSASYIKDHGTTVTIGNDVYAYTHTEGDRKILELNFTGSNGKYYQILLRGADYATDCTQNFDQTFNNLAATSSGTGWRILSADNGVTESAANAMFGSDHWDIYLPVYFDESKCGSENDGVPSGIYPILDTDAEGTIRATIANSPARASGYWTCQGINQMHKLVTGYMDLVNRDGNTYAQINGYTSSCYPLHCVAKSSSSVGVPVTVNCTAGEGGSANIVWHSANCGDVTYTAVDMPQKFFSGNTITLTATANSGYEFWRWSDEDASVVNSAYGTSRNVTVSGNLTLQAIFREEATNHTVTITAPTNGTITVSYNNGSAQSFTSGSRDIAEGTVLTVTTTPASDYHFGAWTGNGAASVTVNGDKTIGATFAQNDYFLNATYGAGGASVTRSDNGNNETVKRAGNTVTLTPTAATGYEFLAWGGADAAKMSGNVFTFPTNGTHNTTYNVQATFQAITYSISYEGLNGATNSNPATYTIETATFALADPGTRTGYTFNNWTCGGNAITQIAVGSTGDKTITANWTPNTNTAYTVKHYQQNVTMDGYTEVEGDRQNLTGTTAAPTAAVANTYTGFTAQEFSQGTIAADGSTVVSINYNRNLYTLTWDFAGGATATAEGDYTHGTVAYGTTIVAPANPTRSGYTFMGWSSDVVSTMPAANTTYTATWAEGECVTLLDNENDTWYDNFKTNHDGKTVTALYSRTFTQGRWSTLCLPFDVNRSMMMTQKLNGSVYEFKYATGDANVGDNVMLYFAKANTMEAGKCYIVNANSTLAAKTSFTFSNVTFNLANDLEEHLTSASAYDNLPETKTQGTIGLVGTLRKGTLIGTATGNTYMGLKNNKIWYPNPSVGNVILAYRGLFRSTEALNAGRVRIVVEGETVTELEVVNGEMVEATEAKKFVQDGILYIERDGVIYNAQGQKVN